ncbi:MAG: hypothetical protein JHC93_03290 [Parachlamydiales bacterium]|nr:hypothetical protein [Parachlamydiales bacterium]
MSNSSSINNNSIPIDIPDHLNENVSNTAPLTTIGNYLNAAYNATSIPSVITGLHNKVNAVKNKVEAARTTANNAIESVGNAIQTTKNVYNAAIDVAGKAQTGAVEAKKFYDSYAPVANLLLDNAGINIPNTGMANPTKFNLGALATFAVHPENKANEKIEAVNGVGPIKNILIEDNLLDRAINEGLDKRSELKKENPTKELERITEQFVYKSSYLGSMIFVREKLFRNDPLEANDFFYKSLLKTAQDKATINGVIDREVENKVLIELFCTKQYFRFPKLARFLFNFTNSILFDIINATASNAKEKIETLFNSKENIYKLLTIELEQISNYIQLKFFRRKEFIDRANGKNPNKLNHGDLEKYEEEELVKPETLGGRSVKEHWNTLNSVIANNFLKIDPVGAPFFKRMSDKNEKWLENSTYKTFHDKFFGPFVSHLVKPLVKLIFIPVNWLRAKILRTTVKLALDRIEVIKSPLQDTVNSDEFTVKRMQGINELLMAIYQEQALDQNDKSKIDGKQVEKQDISDLKKPLHNILCNLEKFLSVDQKNTIKEIGNELNFLNADNNLNVEQWIKEPINKQFVDAGMDIFEDLFRLLSRDGVLGDKFTYVADLALKSFDPPEDYELGKKYTPPDYRLQINHYSNSIIGLIKKISEQAANDAFKKLETNEAVIAETLMQETYTKLQNDSFNYEKEVKNGFHDAEKTLDSIGRGRIYDINQVQGAAKVLEDKFYNIVLTNQQYRTHLNESEASFGENTVISKHGDKENKKIHEQTVAHLTNLATKNTNQVAALKNKAKELSKLCDVLPNVDAIKRVLNKIQVISSADKININSLKTAFTELNEVVPKTASYLKTISELQSCILKLTQNRREWSKFKKIQQSFEALPSNIKIILKDYEEYDAASLAINQLTVLQDSIQRQLPKEDILKQFNILVNLTQKAPQSISPKTLREIERTIKSQAPFVIPVEEEKSTGERLKNFILGSIAKSENDVEEAPYHIIHRLILTATDDLNKSRTNTKKKILSLRADISSCITNKLVPNVKEIQNSTYGQRESTYISSLNKDLDYLIKIFEEQPSELSDAFKLKMENACVASNNLDITTKVIIQRHSNEFDKFFKDAEKISKDFRLCLAKDIEILTNAMKNDLKIAKIDLIEFDKLAKKVGSEFIKYDIVSLGDKLEVARGPLMKRIQGVIESVLEVAKKKTHLEHLVINRMLVQTANDHFEPKKKTVFDNIHDIFSRSKAN